MKLISESVEHVKYITEAVEGGKKNFFIEGIFMQGGIANRNRRIYPKDTLVNEAKRYAKELVETKRAYGELGHPIGPTINLDRVSHRIVELKQIGESGDIYGKAQLLDTPMGNIARGIIESGGVLGVSTRGMGSIKEGKDGLKEVQNDFFLATAADIVADPSAPDAFVNGIMESVEWVYGKNGQLEKHVVEAHDEIEKAVVSRSLDEAMKITIFENFINSL